MANERAMSDRILQNAYQRLWLESEPRAEGCRPLLSGELCDSLECSKLTEGKAKTHGNFGGEIVACKNQTKNDSVF